MGNKAEIRSTRNGSRDGDDKVQVEANVLKDTIDDVKQELGRVRVLVKPFEDIGTWEICWNQVQTMYPAVQSLKQDFAALEKQHLRDRGMLSELQSAQRVDVGDACIGGSSSSKQASSVGEDLYNVHSLMEHALVKQTDMLRVVDALTRDISTSADKRDRASTQERCDATLTKEEIGRDLSTLKEEVLAQMRSEVQSLSAEIHKAVVEPQTLFGEELRKLSDVFSSMQVLASKPPDHPSKSATVSERG